MKITLGNLGFVTKRLQLSAHEAGIKVYGNVNPPMTPGESNVMAYLVEQAESKSISEIVAGTGLVQSWVSTVVKSLKERGWVLVGRDQDDKRVTTVIATPEVLAAASEIHSKDASYGVDPLLGRATKAEEKIIKQGLETLYTVLRREK